MGGCGEEIAVEGSLRDFSAETSLRQRLRLGMQSAENLVRCRAGLLREPVAGLRWGTTEGN